MFLYFCIIQTKYTTAAKEQKTKKPKTSKYILMLLGTEISKLSRYEEKYYDVNFELELSMNSREIYIYIFFLIQQLLNIFKLNTFLIFFNSTNI